MSDDSSDVPFDGPDDFAALRQSQGAIKDSVALPIRHRLHFVENPPDSRRRIFCITRRVHTGPASQGFNTKPGIVGERNVVHKSAVVLRLLDSAGNKRITGFLDYRQTGWKRIEEPTRHVS